MAIVSIQRGTATIAVGATSVNVTISAVTLARSYVNITGMRSNVEAGSGEWRRQQASAALTTTTNITFALSTATNGNNLQINYEVIEDDSLTVQAGTNAAVGTVNIAITAVNLARTFAINWRSGDPGDNLQSAYHRARLTTTTNLQLANTVSAWGGLSSWYVVQGANQNVQQVEGTIGTTGTTLDVTITSVSLNNTVLRGRSLAQGTNNNTPNTRNLFALISATAFRFSRQAAAAYTADYTMFVVEDTNFQVQRGSVNFAATNSVSATITAVDLAKTLSIQGQSYGPGYSTNYTATTSNHADLPSQFLDSTTSILFQRVRTTNVNLICHWEVAQEVAAATPPVSKFFLTF